MKEEMLELMIEESERGGAASERKPFATHI
jgi:hypothetical protein